MEGKKPDLAILIGRMRGGPMGGKDMPAPAESGGKEDLVLEMEKPTMPSVKFPHEEHADDYKVACKTCHHPDGEIQACTACHSAKAEPGKGLSFKTAAHKTCIGCHKEMKEGPTACTKCHTG